MFILKFIRYLIEMQFLLFFYIFCKLLRIDKSSKSIGFVAEKIGPLLGISKRADKNLKKAFQNLNFEERKRIIEKMWNNLGRTSAEFFNIKTLIKDEDRIKIKGKNVIEKYKNQGVIYVSGHLANWEIIPIAIMRKDKKVAAVFRESNNFLFNNWMIKQRKLITKNQFPKGISGTKEILNFLKNKGSVAMLVDQKLSNGVKAKFFKMDAMTASVPATLALKYRYPIVPLNVRRIKNVTFEIEFFPSIEINESGNLEEDILNFTNKINQFLEEKIIEKPEEWFWLHNRWDKRFN
ncbi:MAG: hypothetical protein VX575_01240 [Pseudomonadota bacterium]|nr:hypothetical protein [Pseudomonadota bacterium]MEC7830596.1 hypothetical protein [Pseudomonadota bacterium]MEC9382564.1 hypothetical protein [Pseudomonadota bacterium]MEC9481320.1 hypothetical protein [Pseudomonadota bacterium]